MPRASRAYGDPPSTTQRDFLEGYENALRAYRGPATLKTKVAKHRRKTIRSTAKKTNPWWHREISRGTTRPPSNALADNNGSGGVGQLLQDDQPLDLSDLEGLDEIPSPSDEEITSDELEISINQADVNPALAIAVRRYHELWDPDKKDLYTIRGRIFYSENLVRSGQGKAWRLVSLTLKVQRAQIPISKVRCLREHGVVPSKFPLIEATTIQSRPIDATAAVTSRVIQQQQQQTARTPATGTLNLGYLQEANRFQFSDFELSLPVGTAAFEGTTSGGDVTRLFVLKANGLSKLGSNIKKLESREVNLSVTVLRKRELMDGQEARIRLTASEERRRALLRTY